MIGSRKLQPPPRDTALDRAWRRRQWRLERAHDDWALHAASGDPRAPIHRAAGLVRLCRQSVRDKVHAYRRTVTIAGDERDELISAKSDVTKAIRRYRLAVAALAQTVAAFDERNAGIRTTASPSRQGNAQTPVIEAVC